MSKEKTVFVAGNFNVLHPGHLRLLRFASECGGKLIVGVFSDRISGEASYVPEELRLEGVKSNSWVDQVILIDDSVTEIIDKIRPDIVVKEKNTKINLILKKNSSIIWNLASVGSGKYFLFTGFITKIFSINTKRYCSSR